MTDWTNPQKARKEREYWQNQSFKNLEEIKTKARHLVKDIEQINQDLRDNSIVWT